MTNVSPSAAVQSCGHVVRNDHVSSGLIRLDLELQGPAALESEFLPGQFAMFNLAGGRAFVFGRPFSILESGSGKLALLYRVVGRGTKAMEQLRCGDEVTILGPLGQPFSKPADNIPVVLIGGGVGLPPVRAWLDKFGRPGDLGFFGARDGADVPWELLDESWHISVDQDKEVPSDRSAWQGLVTDLVAREIPDDDTRERLVLACGPIPLLKAAADLASSRKWKCQVSLEEHMGCGYGACKGCVVPVLDAQSTWRNATCCQEGPVFFAETIDWSRYGVPANKPDFNIAD